MTKMESSKKLSIGIKRLLSFSVIIALFCLFLIPFLGLCTTTYDMPELGSFSKDSVLFVYDKSLVNEELLKEVALNLNFKAENGVDFACLLGDETLELLYLFGREGASLNNEYISHIGDRYVIFLDVESKDFSPAFFIPEEYKTYYREITNIENEFKENAQHYLEKAEKASKLGIIILERISGFFKRIFSISEENQLDKLINEKKEYLGKPETNYLIIVKTFIDEINNKLKGIINEREYELSYNPDELFYINEEGKFTASDRENGVFIKCYGEDSFALIYNNGEGSIKNCTLEFQDIILKGNMNFEGFFTNNLHCNLEGTAEIRFLSPFEFLSGGMGLYSLSDVSRAFDYDYYLSEKETIQLSKDVSIDDILNKFNKDRYYVSPAKNFNIMIGETSFVSNNNVFSIKRGDITQSADSIFVPKIFGSNIEKMASCYAGLAYYQKYLDLQEGDSLQEQDSTTKYSSPSETGNARTTQPAPMIESEFELEAGNALSMSRLLLNHFCYENLNEEMKSPDSELDGRRISLYLSSLPEASSILTSLMPLLWEAYYKDEDTDDLILETVINNYKEGMIVRYLQEVLFRAHASAQANKRFGNLDEGWWSKTFEVLANTGLGLISRALESGNLNRAEIIAGLELASLERENSISGSSKFEDIIKKRYEYFKELNNSGLEKADVIKLDLGEQYVLPFPEELETMTELCESGENFIPNSERLFQGDEYIAYVFPKFELLSLENSNTGIGGEFEILDKAEEFSNFANQNHPSYLRLGDMFISVKDPTSIVITDEFMNRIKKLNSCLSKQNEKPIFIIPVVKNIYGAVRFMGNNVYSELPIQDNEFWKGQFNPLYSFSLIIDPNRFGNLGGSGSMGFCSEDISGEYPVIKQIPEELLEPEKKHDEMLKNLNRDRLYNKNAEKVKEAFLDSSYLNYFKEQLREVEEPLEKIENIAIIGKKPQKQDVIRNLDDITQNLFDKRRVFESEFLSSTLFYNINGDVFDSKPGEDIHGKFPEQGDPGYSITKVFDDSYKLQFKDDVLKEEKGIAIAERFSLFKRKPMNMALLLTYGFLNSMNPVYLTGWGIATKVIGSFIATSSLAGKASSVISPIVECHFIKNIVIRRLASFVLEELVIEEGTNMLVGRISPNLGDIGELLVSGFNTIGSGFDIDLLMVGQLRSISDLGNFIEFDLRKGKYDIKPELNFVAPADGRTMFAVMNGISRGEFIPFEIGKFELALDSRANQIYAISYDGHNILDYIEDNGISNEVNKELKSLLPDKFKDIGGIKKESVLQLILESYEKKTKEELSLDMKNFDLSKVEEEYAWRDSALLGTEYTSKWDYGKIEQEVNEKLQTRAGQRLTIQDLLADVKEEKRNIAIKNILTLYVFYRDKVVGINYDWRPAGWDTSVPLEEKFLEYIYKNRDDVIKLINAISDLTDANVLRKEHSFFTDSFVSTFDSYFTKDAEIDPFLERIEGFNSFINSNPELMDFMKPSEIFYLYGRGVFSDTELFNHFNRLIEDLSAEVKLSNIFSRLLLKKSNMIKKRTVALFYYNLIQFNEDLNSQGKANLMNERVKLLIKDKLVGYPLDNILRSHMYGVRNSIRVRLGNLDLNKDVFRVYRNLDKDSFDHILNVKEGKENHKPWLFWGTEEETQKNKLIDELNQAYTKRFITSEEKFNEMLDIYKKYLSPDQTTLLESILEKNKIQAIMSSIKNKGFEQDFKLLKNNKILSQSEINKYFNHPSRDAYGIRATLYSNSPFTPILCFSSSGTLFDELPIRMTAEIPLSEYGIRFFSSKNVGLSMGTSEGDITFFDEWDYTGELDNEYIKRIDIQKQSFSQEQLDSFYISNELLNEFASQLGVEADSFVYKEVKLKGPQLKTEQKSQYVYVLQLNHPETEIKKIIQNAKESRLPLYVVNDDIKQNSYMFILLEDQSTGKRSVMLIAKGDLKETDPKGRWKLLDYLDEKGYDQEISNFNEILANAESFKPLDSSTSLVLEFFFNKDYVKFHEENNGNTEINIIEITKKDMILKKSIEYLVESDTGVYTKGDFLYFKISDGYKTYNVPIKEKINEESNGGWKEIPSVNKKSAKAEIRTRDDFIDDFKRTLSDNSVKPRMLNLNEKLSAITGINRFANIDNSFYSKSNPVRVLKGKKGGKDLFIYEINLETEDFKSELPDSIKSALLQDSVEEHTYFYSLSQLIFYYDRVNNIIIPLGKRNGNTMTWFSTDNEEMVDSFQKNVFPWITDSKDISVFEKICAVSQLNELRLDKIHAKTRHSQLLENAIDKLNLIKEDFGISSTKELEKTSWTGAYSNGFTEKLEQKVKIHNEEEAEIIKKLSGRKALLEWGHNELVIDKEKGKINSEHSGLGIIHMMGFFDKVTVKGDVYGTSDIKIDLTIEDGNKRLFPSDFKTLIETIENQLKAKDVEENIRYEIKNRIISSLGTHNHFTDLKPSGGDTIKGLMIFTRIAEKINNGEVKPLIYVDLEHNSLIYEVNLEDLGFAGYLSIVLKPEKPETVSDEDKVVPITTFFVSDESNN